MSRTGAVMESVEREPESSKKIEICFNKNKKEMPGARGGGGCAASVRDVCGPESDMPCPPCVVS